MKVPIINGMAGSPDRAPLAGTLPPCEFNVNEKGVVRDTFTFLPMTGPFLRKLFLSACVGSEGYLIGRDDAIRARSNAEVGAFLMRAFNGEGAATGR